MKITINLPNTEREREVFLKSFEKNGISKQMANSLELLLHQKSFQTAISAVNSYKGSLNHG